MAVPFTFLNYDKISDNLLWLGYTEDRESVTLKFCVNLVKQDLSGNERHFHSEYKYYSKKFERNSQSITRSYDFYYTINASGDTYGCMLKMSDVQILNMIFDNTIIPWFTGPTRIFNMIDDKMVISGEFNEVTIPLSERTYLKFSPVVINYENTNSYKEGVRLEINSQNTYVDITVDKFMDLVYILHNTDMVNLAATMINYVKIPPYNINSREGAGFNPTGARLGNFFDK